MTHEQDLCAGLGQTDVADGREAHSALKVAKVVSLAARRTGDEAIVEGQSGRKLGVVLLGRAHQAWLDAPGLQGPLAGMGVIGRSAQTAAHHPGIKGVRPDCVV